jgi:hypothetical protein
VRIILDECLPRRLPRDLQSHQTTTVPRQGWSGFTNGALLHRIEGEFDVFITMDSNIVHQQNMTGLRVNMVVLHAPNSRYETLQPLVPHVLAALAGLGTGAVIHVGA